MKIKYPENPLSTHIPDLNNFQNIKDNWKFSYDTLTKINSLLIDKFGNSEDFSIIVSGSFGRMEASQQSDLDFIIISDAKEFKREKEIRDIIITISKELKIPPPNENGVFSRTLPKSEIMDKIGHNEDDLYRLAQRMLLLMESKPLYNEVVFQNTVNQILKKYLELIIDDPKKEALFLLNDLIRYFRSIAVNYEYNFWKDNEKWTLRNVKLRHSRVLIYAGLLLLILNASKNRENKLEYFKEHIFLTPLEKIASVYNDCSDYNLHKVIAIYDVFLSKVNNSEIRKKLQVEYKDRYKNPYYSELKVTSEAFMSELTRFIFSQKGNWTEQVYEYLIF